MTDIQQVETVKHAWNREVYKAGQTIGNCIYIKDAESNTKNKSRKALFKCKCGNEFKATVTNVKNGNTNSCGNHKHTVGHLLNDVDETNYTLKVFEHMKQRCYNKNCPSYKYYGGKGVTICERWLSNPKTFVEDMGYRPKCLTIERIDHTGNYEPNNCRWATIREQNRNKSSNVFLTLNGETLCAADWAMRYSSYTEVIISRLRRGWSAEKAITEPIQFKNAKSTKSTRCFINS